MRWFGTSTTAATTGDSFGKFTRTVEVTGRCPCGQDLAGVATVTTVLGETGTAEATATHSCGASARLTGDY